MFTKMGEAKYGTLRHKKKKKKWEDKSIQQRIRLKEVIPEYTF